MNQNNDVNIRMQPTPNPQAWKFILDQLVLSQGKASYTRREEAYGNQLALDLISIVGVRQIHFFQNVITVTAQFDADADAVIDSVMAVIRSRMSVHNPHFGVEESKQMLRTELSPERQKIEEILDRTIRPGLQGDGGDIEVLKYENNKLYVHYEGACGTCPSATSGTLMSIESILRHEYDPEIEVVPVEN